MGTQLLTLESDPEITSLFLAQVDQARPGKYKAYSAYSPQEFRNLANAHKREVDTVVLGAAQTMSRRRPRRKLLGKFGRTARFTF